MIDKKVPLCKLTSIRLTGWINLEIVETIEEIENISGFLIGGGSNLIIKDKNKKFFQLSCSFSYVKLQGDTLVCGGFLNISKLIRFEIQHSISSLEFLAGIPATVGGCIYMNAGAFGETISDKLIYLKAFSKKDGIINLSREDIEFSYRKSNLDNMIIVEAGFSYSTKNRQDIINRVKNNIKKRVNTAHLSNTFGSVFKNPYNDYAGRLLEESGLKGLQRNSARFSQKHANYIIGNGHTNSDDVLFLIDEAKRRVFANFGIELEEEVKIV